MNGIAAGGAALALLACLAAAGCAGRPADPSYCGVAQTGYRNALAEVNQHLSQYSSCLGRSTGAADCAADFSALRSAQANLETSAGDVAQYCKAKP
jgi:hypothetical protein